MFDEFYYYPKYTHCCVRLIKLYFFQIVKERYYVYLNPKAYVKAVMVEDDGIEPTTPCLQSRCSPS